MGREGGGQRRHEGAVLNGILVVARHRVDEQRERVLTIFSWKAVARLS